MCISSLGVSFAKLKVRADTQPHHQLKLRLYIIIPAVRRAANKNMYEVLLFYIIYVIAKLEGDRRRRKDNFSSLIFFKRKPVSLLMHRKMTAEMTDWQYYDHMVS